MSFYMSIRQWALGTCGIISGGWEIKKPDRLVSIVAQDYVFLDFFVGKCEKLEEVSVRSTLKEDKEVEMINRQFPRH